MNQFRRTSFLVTLVFFSSLPWALADGIPRAEPKDVGLSAERLARIDQVMQGYIAADKVSGTVTVVARKGKVAHWGVHGKADREANKPMQADTIFRIASMTKPITSVAVMMLYEEGRFLLNDPVSKFIPELKSPQVLAGKSLSETEPAKAEVTIKHLLTHTAGFTYQWDERLGQAINEAGVTHGLLQDEKTLGEGIEALARLPLVHHPGEKFNYGLSIDVLGRLVEVVSGMTLDEFFQKRMFGPLGMKDTHFYLPGSKRERLAAVYERNETGPIRRVGEGQQKGDVGLAYSVSYPYDGTKSYYSGGGGLVSTAGDYLRFAQMLLNGGELAGARLLGSKTVELMVTDHVGELLDSGFGLGFSVIRQDDARNDPASLGTFGWGGFFYTTFFIDPEEELIGIYMSQLHPTGGLDLASKFRVLAYQSIVD